MPEKCEKKADEPGPGPGNNTLEYTPTRSQHPRRFTAQMGRLNSNLRYPFTSASLKACGFIWAIKSLVLLGKSRCAGWGVRGAWGGRRRRATVRNSCNGRQWSVMFVTVRSGLPEGPYVASPYNASSILRSGSCSEKDQHPLHVHT